MIEKTLTEEKREEIRSCCVKNNKPFTKVYLSVSAGSKMLNHSCSGIPNEVMGLLQGFYQ